MNDTNIKKKPMLNYINVFRGIAIILILMAHTMQFGEAGSDRKSTRLNSSHQR